MGCNQANYPINQSEHHKNEDNCVEDDVHDHTSVGRGETHSASTKNSS